jgi:hypothetical protein
LHPFITWGFAWPVRLVNSVIVTGSLSCVICYLVAGLALRVPPVVRVV